MHQQIQLLDVDISEVGDTDFVEEKIDYTGRFLSFDRIIADLLATLDDPDRAFIRKLKRAQLPDFILAFGPEIRTSYGLWHPANPYTVKNHVPDYVNGIDVSPYHPENFSAEVIRTIHRKLQYIS